jgi:hypothetical protein
MKYLVDLEYTLRRTIEVEASSEEEAVEEAELSIDWSTDLNEFDWDDDHTATPA